MRTTDMESVAEPITNSTMKLELEFEITKIEDGFVEGTWQASEEGEQSMMAEFITQYIVADEVIKEKWGINSPGALDRMTKSLGVSFYNEDGRDIWEISHGIFTAWEHGVPAL